MGTEGFAEKFEKALQERKEREPEFGVRTLARILSKGDPKATETIRRRLNKYRPKPGGGAAEVAPTAPSRWEIEEALGLERDALKPDEQALAALGSIPVRGLESLTIGELFHHLADDAIAAVLMERLDVAREQKNNAPAAHMAASSAGASTTGG